MYYKKVQWDVLGQGINQSGKTKKKDQVYRALIELYLLVIYNECAIYIEHAVYIEQAL